jgi:3' terminal RNA ribose 2'-O-methyltransferase Hen1
MGASMQIEITLHAVDTGYSARDLGRLLHKHPDHLHERETTAGRSLVFFPNRSDEMARAVLFLDVDPIGLVRGRSPQADGLLTQYVNDRPYAANSLLSVALGRTFGQSMQGRSRECQDLADRALPFEVRLVPVAVAGGAEIAERLFAPLGYELDLRPVAGNNDPVRPLFDLRLKAHVRLADLLTHLYVLVPVLDNTKHYAVERNEVEVLLAKGEGWLAQHPEKTMIAKRALRYRRVLSDLALARLNEAADAEDEEETAANEEAKEQAEQVLEQPIRLHDLRLDTVVAVLKERGTRSVLDLGCGEGRLLRRLIRERAFERIVGVDASPCTLERAADRLYLRDASDAMRRRVTLQMGSLTYSDRRWEGFDAAALVEVIEHIEPVRLSSLEISVFGNARPRVVIVTTPNREYNALFPNMAPDALRHADHRFEWTRTEFSAWTERVAEEHGYSVELSPLGPENPTHGAPSQMAVFELKAGSTATARDIGEVAQ